MDRAFLQHAVLLSGGEIEPADSPAAAVLEKKGTLDGQPAAYVCSDFTCRPPVAIARDLERKLKR